MCVKGSTPDRCRIAENGISVVRNCTTDLKNLLYVFREMCYDRRGMNEFNTLKK